MKLLLNFAEGILPLEKSEICIIMPRPLVRSEDELSLLISCWKRVAFTGNPRVLSLFPKVIHALLIKFAYEPYLSKLHPFHCMHKPIQTGEDLSRRLVSIPPREVKKGMWIIHEETGAPGLVTFVKWQRPGKHGDPKIIWQTNLL